MLVWRVEHETRFNSNPDLVKHYAGPFRRWEDDVTCGAASYVSQALIDWGHFNKFDTPEEEGLPFASYMVCGCLSIQQLAQWFHHEAGLAAMAELGYVVRSYEVPEIALHKGKHQCTFVISHARPVAQHALRVLIDANTMPEAA